MNHLKFKIFISKLIALAFLVNSLPLVAQVNFGVSGLTGTSVVAPTCLQLGPDGKLYVSERYGVIHVYDVIRNGANDYEVTNTSIIDIINTIPNHNDDGTVNPTVTNRLITGMLVEGTPSNPIIYIASSDPRTNEDDTTQLGIKSNLDTNSGMISKLTKTNNLWSKIDLVRGLPRSEEVHATNGMDLDPINNVLYVSQGGHTNMGSPSFLFSYTPEYALSSAILSIDLTAIGNTTFDLPTLNDEDRTDVSNPVPGKEDEFDPFGGNQGKNMAMLTVNSPVQVYASGFRNAYDVLISTSGRIYSIDNGPNGGYGGWPVACSNDTVEGGTSSKRDGLFYLNGPGFYAGHANPTRGDFNNTFNASNPQHAVDASLINPAECVYNHLPDVIYDFDGSTNGFCEYTASNFGNIMKGDLVAAYLDGELYRIKLNAQGDSLSLSGNGVQVLASNFGGDPLDVTAQGDSAVYPGTVWAACFGSDAIVIFEPADYSGQSIPCNLINPNFDSDGDCFSNQDEDLNGTDPCNAADHPSDYDEDCISDLVDSDDDNDGILDELDYFALDSSNGNLQFIPYHLEFDNIEKKGIQKWGFTGMMNNLTDNYRVLYDVSNMTVGAAAEKFTIDSIPAGDAHGTLNNQEYGFQLGVNTAAAVNDFVVRTRVSIPFAAISPQGEQSHGIYLGLGTQFDYLKLVLHAVDGNGGLQMVYEEGDANTPIVFEEQDAAILTANFVDLYFKVKKDVPEVQAYYAVNGDTLNPVFAPISIPINWVDSVMAIGFISTSRDAFKYSATWDDLEIYYEDLTSIHEIEPYEFKVFPNPSNGLFTVKCKDLSAGQDLSLLILDSSGRIVYNSKHKVKNTSFKTTLDLSQLSKGVYCMQVVSASDNGFKTIILE